MGLLQNLKERLLNNVVKKALEKGAKKAALAIVALVVARSVDLQSVGLSVSVDPDVLAVALLGLLEALRTSLKRTLGEKVPSVAALL